MRLKRSDPATSGWTRRRNGRGFVFLDSSGASLDPEAVSRCKQLVIPPAWREVWICPFPNGHIQAVGVDDAGRRQYLYHPEWRSRRDTEKYDRVLRLAPRLPRFRAAVSSDMRGRGRVRRLAVALRMLDLGMFRVGHEEYVDDGTHGVATLLRSHVTVRRDSLFLCFPAKSGVEVAQEVHDPALVRGIRPLLRGLEPVDRIFDLTADDINDHFRSLVGDEFSVKDLRTWHATVFAAEAFARLDSPSKRAVARVMKEVAEELGNTPAVARSSYVDPRLVDAFLEGNVIGTRGDPERAVLRLLR
jgi:DNA topoisomerase I